MQKPLKRIIAIEFSKTQQSLIFELFEVLEAGSLSLKDKWGLVEIAAIKKKSIGFINVSSNDLVFIAQKIYKKENLKHIPITRFKSKISFYSCQPEHANELLPPNIANFYAVEIADNKSATSHNRGAIQTIVFNHLQRTNKHYKIRLERVFFCTPLQSDTHANATYTCVNSTNTPHLQAVFTTHNAARICVSNLNHITTN